MYIVYVGSISGRKNELHHLLKRCLDQPCGHLGAQAFAQPGIKLFRVDIASRTGVVLGHCSVKGPFAWPCRLSRQLPIPGAGSYSFAVSCTSVSQPVTLHADSGAAFGPMSLSVAVVG